VYTEYIKYKQVISLSNNYNHMCYTSIQTYCDSNNKIVYYKLKKCTFYYTLQFLENLSNKELSIQVIDY
jgi:hypothetical protein